MLLHLTDFRNPTPGQQESNTLMLLDSKRRRKAPFLFDYVIQIYALSFPSTINAPQNIDSCFFIPMI